MKFINTCRVATFLILAMAVWSYSAVHGQQQQPPKPVPPGEQQKGDKTPPPPPDEEEEQTLKLGSQLVAVPFNVTNKQNAYVNDLAKDNLEVFEDNKPQPIFSFERQTDLPLTIAMLIDISGSQEYTLPYEKAAGQRFFRKVLRPKKDIAAIVTFEHESVLVQNLTGDVEKLHRALDEVIIGTPSVVLRGAGGTPPINNSGAGATAMYDSVYSVSSDLLRREAGRRVIILITDGIDTRSQVNMRQSIERTWRNEVIVYTIGIGDRAYGGINRGVLKKIAEETGGRAFFPRGEEDLDKAFAQIDEDLRSQYLVTYQPTNDTQDGSFRTIQLRVKERKDLHVRHRRGYFAPSQS
ncbi:MAG: VWA domain-containing protein [Blastocatellia bacterium]|nr:VWA domain-containing protein [Blastocatellia bacterium]